MSIGIWQVVLILLIVLIVFGAGKLPKVMGDVAAGVKNFRKGMREDDEGSEAATSTTSKSIGRDAESGAGAATSEREREDETVKS
jgi:sec-independent protein translocase protein TatA